MTNALGLTSEATDLKALRRQIYAQPRVSRADLAQLLSCGDAESPGEYAQLLADVATDLLVNQADPPKYISPSDADWLIGQLNARGGLSRRVEMRMLTDVIRYAVCMPPALPGFCVSEIEKSIVAGRSDHPAGTVSSEDVEALREAVFAAVDGSALHVSRESAEALFRIAHATNEAANAPSFDEFFAKAVGNYLMGIALHWIPSAADEREKEKWLDEAAPGVGGFLGEIFGGTPSPRMDTRAPSQIDEEQLRDENAADARELASASEINPLETDWLMAQLSHPGSLTSAERALLQFLQREAPSLPGKLEARIEEKAA